MHNTEPYSSILANSKQDRLVPRSSTSTLQQFSTCANLPCFSISLLGQCAIVQEEKFFKIPVIRLQFTSIKEEIECQVLGVRCFGNVFCPLFFMRSYVFAKNSKFFFLECVTKQTVRSSSFAQSFRNLFSQHIYPKCLLSHNSAQKRRIKEVTHFKGMIGSSLWLGY